MDGEMPFNTDSLITIGESFLTAGDYGNAMRVYQRAATENPTNVPSRLGLAKTYQAMGAADAAINLYSQVLGLDPNNMEAKMGKGQMLITKNRPEEAIPYLTDLLKQDPKNYKIYNMLGLAYDLMGQQEKAQMSYGQGLEFAVNNISLLNNLALSFAFEEQYPPALRLLSKAINLDHTVIKAQQNLILVYVLSGEEDEGRKIGAGIMKPAELENDIRTYKWVRGLSPSQRAQAIFLGIKDFSDTPEEQNSAPQKDVPTDIVPKSNDPKKRQLIEMLRQEEKTSQKKDEAQIPIEKQQSQKVITDAVTSQEQEQTVYRVQLGSYPNPQLAKKGWHKIFRSSKGLLDRYEPLVKPVTVANGKTLFRLFIGGIEKKIIAKNTCDMLRDKKIACLVLKTAKN